MDIFHLDRTYRHIRRYRQIIGVFVKYGFGGLLEQLNLDYYLAVSKSLVSFRRLRREDLKRLGKGERLRLVLEELGPTFVKLGQLLSTRADLLPPDIVNALRKLQDEVPGFAYDEARKQIESSLEKPLEEVFSNFTRLPVAAASISQVHRARLLCGHEVAVKIRRPDIEEVVATDIDIMFTLAELATRHISELEPYQPVLLVREFAKNIRQELDFQIEGRNLESFAQNFADDKAIHVPDYYPEASSTVVLTMEWIDGVRIDRLSTQEEFAASPKTLAARGADFILRQVLEFGLFHGDPHPGNLLVQPGNVIAPLDFGLVGRLDDDLSFALLELMLGIARQDVDRMLNGLAKIGVIDEDRINARELRKDLYDLLARYTGVSLKNLQMKYLVQDFVRITSYHKIIFPPDFMLLLRVLISIEGTARQLDPDFDFFAHSAPLLTKLGERRFSAAEVEKKLLRRVNEVVSLLEMLPGSSREIMRKLSRGRLRFEFEHIGLTHFSRNLDRIANRISFTMVVSAIIIASSLIMSADNGFKIFGYPLLGIIGYVLAGGLGTWLAIAILRSGKM